MEHSHQIGWIELISTLIAVLAAASSVYSAYRAWLSARGAEEIQKATLIRERTAAMNKVSVDAEHAFDMYERLEYMGVEASRNGLVPSGDWEHMKNNAAQARDNVENERRQIIRMTRTKRDLESVSAKTLTEDIIAAEAARSAIAISTVKLEHEMKVLEDYVRGSSGQDR